MADKKGGSNPIVTSLKFFEGIEVAAWIIPSFFFALFFIAALYFVPQVRYQGFIMAVFLVILIAPFAIPYKLFWWANDEWLAWKQNDFIEKQGGILLEILLPRDIFKSPRAMETALMQMHIANSATWLETYQKGKVRPWYSFEIASFGGSIHFYIWTRPALKDIVESQLYAQYPGIQIVEAVDYTKGISADPAVWESWSTHFKLTGKDAYPIKTYVDYGLDENDKDEYVIDPMAAVIEFMGNLKKEEQMWLQILARPHRAVKPSEGGFKTQPDWTDEVKAEIKTIKEEATQKIKTADGKELPGFPNLTKGQTEKIAALERSMDKLAYDVMIRGVLLATAGNFVGTHVPGLVGSFRQYSSKNLNSFGIAGFTDFDYPWSDPWGRKRAERKRDNIDAYKRRAFFHGKYAGMYDMKSFILTVEELATIYHLPGTAVGTPTLSRIGSVAGEAPSNLPT